MILAAMAGEDLLVAVAIDVGDPEGVAVGQGVVDHGSRPKLERGRLAFRFRQRPGFRARVRPWRKSVCRWRGQDGFRCNLAWALRPDIPRSRGLIATSAHDWSRDSA